MDHDAQRNGCYRAGDGPRLPFICTPVASHMVKPSKPPPYPLPFLRSCSLDRVIANIYVKTVFFFDHRSEPSFFCSDVLTHSLSQALSLFHAFAGTITSDFDVVCDGKGALFLQAIANCTLADVGDRTPHPRLLRLVPSLDPSCDVSLQPLLLIQITRFQCGGVAMGMAVEHHVADGVSALSFLKAWTTIARGEKLEMQPPLFDKTWLRARCPPTVQFSHDEYVKLPKPRRPARRVQEVDPQHEPVVKMFDLPMEFLKRMKGEAGASGLTTYETVTAHVWRCCCKARGLGYDDESMLVMAVDGRMRMKMVGAEAEGGGDGAAAARYVGNVIFNCCVKLRVGKIIGAGSSLWTLGKIVQAALKRTDDSYCRSAIDFLETCTPQQLESFAKGPHTFASPNVGLISWTTFPFYEVDFGWGIPSHVGPVHMPWEGHAYLMRGPASAAGLRLFISLQRRHMKAFADHLFSSAGEEG